MLAFDGPLAILEGSLACYKLQDKPQLMQSLARSHVQECTMLIFSGRNRKHVTVGNAAGPLKMLLDGSPPVL